MSQPALVGRAAHGDRLAFDSLVGASIDRLYAAARLIVRDPDVAEDVVQEALIHCWRELPRLRDHEKFDGWLHRLLVNAAMDHHRRRRRSDAVVRLLHPAPAGDFTAQIAATDEVAVAFDRLRVDHRVVLVLHYYLGLAPAEIADVLRLPGGTVRSRLHYASEAMRAALDADSRSRATHEWRGVG